MQYQERRDRPLREIVFAQSLRYHGYRWAANRDVHLKKPYGYVVLSTRREDAEGIDFWVKPPGADSFVPVQVTQRGIAIFQRRHRDPTDRAVAEFAERCRLRLNEKRRACEESGVAFVLVRDFLGERTNRTLAWGDVKALRNALERVN